MKLKSLSLSLILAAFVSLFATSAYAQSIDARLSVSASLLDWSDNVEYYSNDILAGINGGIEIGIKWTNFGIYIDQDFGGLWDTGKTAHDIALEGKHTGAKLLGATYLMFKGIYGSERIAFDLGLGLGAMYSSKDPYECLIPRMHEDENAAQFALKLTLGFSYFFTQAIGIGLHLDYAIGIKNWDVDYNDRYGWHRSNEWNTHNFMPGAHIAIRL